MTDPIHGLREVLAVPTPPDRAIEAHLAQAWDALAGDDGGMVSRKLHGRMEAVVWNPPMLTFQIERHGATVLGSSRAEVQEWTVDLEQRTKSVVVVGRRQFQPTQRRMNVMPLAEELANAIQGGRQDPRLKWEGFGQVRLLMNNVLPAGSAVKDTLAGRRKRLREAVAALLAPAGWRMVRSNLFVPVEKDGEFPGGVVNKAINT